MCILNHTSIFLVLMSCMFTVMNIQSKSVRLQTRSVAIYLQIILVYSRQKDACTDIGCTNIAEFKLT